MSHKVFVYGSLKNGFHNHRLLEQSKFLGVASGEGYRMVSLGSFPGLLHGDKTVVGELYEVDDNTFKSLDRLEGHPEFYKRLERPFDDGEEVHHAWVYLINGYDHYPEVESCVWERPT